MLCRHQRQRPNGSIYWWCSVRSNKSRCPATVIQSGSNFRPGSHQHNHDSAPGAIIKLKIVSQSKQEAATNVFKPAAQIVNEAMVSHSDHTAPAGSRPNVHNLQTSTNRLREKSRPKDPTDLNFEINYDFLPENFFKKDVVDSNRHLFFATDSQLDALSSAKVWYMDATFKIISKPFLPDVFDTSIHSYW
ncbi:Hypothetical predicted protein [Mytilus galloprovincialis]|uniref:FLYWCH-type domain-containing protein n=1 Tax=Mytilus galloprovincialis TaxID=29158 RepID=A0A8B6GET7_MYTGA|nr:Hypothetical predicted protein [Mytilus galloprovincialis]